MLRTFLHTYREASIRDRIDSLNRKIESDRVGRLKLKESSQKHQDELVKLQEQLRVMTSNG